MGKVGIEITGLDIIDVINTMSDKQAKFLSIMLTNIEEEKLSEEDFAKVRKHVLDGMNDYTRSILRTFFGDIEGLVMK